ncbi:MAG TPA: DUF1156 domain-containing protein [Anaerolineae bacterium]|nr:DUF1156 domain-containing protein [Anaerolineae bacterium]HQH37453.1 DUF1156 domain-containing protein [Anaerolineae bacterium]
MPQSLIESWLPFDAVGAESLRDASAAQKPPLNRLHVWWARRPLTISRAAIVASLLPSWDRLEACATNPFANEDAYRAWFLHFLGIKGDPAAMREQLLRARETGENLGANPYGYGRAFTVSPSADDLALFERLLDLSGCGRADRSLQDTVLLDPFSGGGSIPFEARRYGLSVIANELNPVACVILKATLDYPATFGPELAADIKKWGNLWAKRVHEKLAPYFPKGKGENIFAYLWARTVACPVTGKPVPLSPNWWLSKSPPCAVRLLTDPAWDAPRFEIYTPGPGDDPDDGTVARGVGRSPWTGDAIDGDYIKAEAQAGRMGQMFYAVALKRRGGFDFRAPTQADLDAVAAAEAELARQRPLWEAQDVIPTEEIDTTSNYDRGHRLYGITTWAEMFSPRQLLSLGAFVETLQELRVDLSKELNTERANAVETYLALAIDKSTDYNSIQAGWHSSRQVVAHTFTKHNFSMTWDFSEFDASANLLPWSIDQITDAYRDIAKLAMASQVSLDSNLVERGPLTQLQGNAAHIASLADASVDVIVTDPPYYDNVMYAELADFFYVWLKRTVGHLYPLWFSAPLTDKDAEAVANPARFKDIAPALTPGASPRGRGGRGAREMAAQDYERKMGAAFREMARVLRDDGVLTVMFTHKQVEAWDTLAMALINAGFTITASWPVHTESEYSLHQARKNAAQSTILLVCRKRKSESANQRMGESANERISASGIQYPASSSRPSASGSEYPVWWDDLAPRVRTVAREKAAEFNAQGISGVDLYLSTFGPVLAVISERWPVLTRQVDERTGQPKALRPETALDLAREEVIALRKRGLLLGHDVQFDPVTDWVLMAWDAFQAETFPADEARKLALALGLDVERDLVAQRVISKSGSDVTMLQPKQRRVRGRVDPEAQQYDTWLDAIHTVMLVYAEDGTAACAAFLKKSGLRADSTFKAVLQAFINAVPRAQAKGRFVRPEAAALDGIRATFFEELEVPVEEEERVEMVQGKLL